MAAPTPVGTLGAPGAAAVDSRGLTTVDPTRWSLDWYVGAEDGWHVPSTVAVGRLHQRLVDAAPVVETSMRVPGGEVVQRAYGAYWERDGVVVVEVENQSRVPVALALAVRPHGLEGEGAIARITMHDDAIEVDGVGAVTFARPPAFVATGTSRAGDSAEQVFAGTQARLGDVDRSIADDGGGANAAYVFPLAHGATLRAALSPAGVVPASVLPTLPAPDVVASGWSAQRDRGMRVVLPDERWQQAIDANRCFLLLEAARAGTAWNRAAPLLEALDGWGYGDAAEQARLASPFRARRAAARRRRFAAPLDVGEIDRLLDAASPTWTWEDGVARSGAHLLSSVRRLLVREERDRCLALAALVPDSWLGQGVEVHDAPTPLGTVSYAVRWHGARPALLWDVRPALPAGARVTAPGLDSTWSSNESRGDALLGAVEPPGGLPKVYRPLPDVQPGEADEAPDPGRGFV